MMVAEKSKFLGKQKLCYGCFKSISAKHTAHNCPKRRTCKICLGKHPIVLHGFQYKKKDGTTEGNSKHQQQSVTSNCANVDNIDVNRLALKMSLACVWFQ